MSSLSRQISELPRTPGVYAFRDKQGRLLYVGKAVNLQRRVASYLKAGGGHTGYTRKLKRVAKHVEHLETGSELEALLLEAKHIREAQPAYNVVGRHARHYGFVRLTPERFPKVEVVRELAQDGGQYYGPFPPELDLASAVAGLQSLLGWRSCAQLERRPCLHHQLGRCLAPCGMSDPAPYDAMMAMLRRILAGQGGVELDLLAIRRDEAARALDFERAAKLRDRHRSLAELLGRAPLLTLDAVVVEGRGSAGSRLMALRAGRLVAAREMPPGPGEELEAIALTFLAQVWSQPAPGPASTPGELRHVDVVCGYLNRHGGQNVVRIDHRQLSQGARAIVGLLQARKRVRTA